MDFNLSWLQNPALSQYIAFSIMYISGVFISNFPISCITGKLYLFQLHKLEDTSYLWKYSRKQSAILGMVERALFITAFLIKVPEFIAFWFTIKMAFKWKTWSKRGGRLFYNNFLIGNGLSFFFSISSYSIFKMSFIHDLCKRFTFMGISFLSPYILSLIIFLNVNNLKKELENIYHQE